MKPAIAGIALILLGLSLFLVHRETSYYALVYLVPPIGSEAVNTPLAPALIQATLRILQIALIVAGTAIVLRSRRGSMVRVSSDQKIVEK